MLEALRRKYDDAVEKETQSKVSSEKKLEDVKKEISQNAMPIHAECQREIERSGKTCCMSVENWNSAIEIIAERHHQRNKQKEFTAYIAYFVIYQKILKEIKGNIKITEDMHIGKSLREDIDRLKQGYLEKCENFISSNYIINGHNDHVPNFRDEIDELCEIWRALDYLNEWLLNIKVELLLKDIELRYLKETSQKILGSHASVEALQTYHREMVKTVLASVQGPDSEIIRKQKDRIESVLNDHLDRIKNWNEGNKSFFKRTFGGLASGSGIALGSAAGIGAGSVIVTTGAVTLSVAAAATGIGVGILVGVAVGGLGFAIYEKKKASKTKRFVDEQITKVEERAMADEQD